MLQHKSYADAVSAFRWQIPSELNLGFELCDKHAIDADRLALISIGECGVEKFTFRQIECQSNKLGNALLHLGVRRGDRVGILLSQRPETGISHVACFKIGAISLPLFTQFGPDAVRFRLANSSSVALITDEENIQKVLAVRDDLPELRAIIVVDRPSTKETIGYQDLVEKSSDSLTLAKTLANDPALIVYTSGTTGPPKGALHAHRIMEAHKPAIDFTQDGFPVSGDCFWTPAEWAWGGGLFNSLFGSWCSGVPIVAHRFRKFDPEQAFHLIAQHGVRNSFMPPTALKMMREVPASKRPNLDMRSINSGGESLGAETLEWAKEVFGLTINEFWGQTEANFLTGNSAKLMPTKPGSIGRATPGHTIEVVNEAGEILPRGQTGIIAAKGPDPIFFLNYWNNPEGTKAKFAGDWLLTGDTGYQDDDGFFWFQGRNDDIISSGAYRIGPSEIESCIASHADVAAVAVIGAPDPLRGEIVKAFVVLNEGTSASDDLKKSIQSLVRQRLAAYQYPREVEFMECLPMTPSGKVQRSELRALEKRRRQGET